jgi:hypothetical protein
MTQRSPSSRASSADLHRAFISHLIKGANFGWENTSARKLLDVLLIAGCRWQVVPTMLQGGHALDGARKEALIAKSTGFDRSIGINREMSLIVLFVG